MEEPEVLDFTEQLESPKETSKKQKIANILEKSPDGKVDLDTLLHLARTEYGLVSDDNRRLLWPQILNIDVHSLQPAPTLSDLSDHPEYNQIILDVNRSLKRFPPGIPYDQRIALQDQLTVLILRVIKKHPHLRYYQGYHDVAITFLLVVGEEIAFEIMDYLSVTHFAECMQETMEATQKKLMYIWPVIKGEDELLYDFINRSEAGNLFALPWYLTWFGHSINKYRLVVRLYDYFLASPVDTSLYVTAAIVLHRKREILTEECDMAVIHCLLSTLPNDLPMEKLLIVATNLSEKYPMSTLGDAVNFLLVEELRLSKITSRKSIRSAGSPPYPWISWLNNQFKWMSQYITHRTLLVTTAFSILIGFCAYYYNDRFLKSGVS